MKFQRAVFPVMTATILLACNLLQPPITPPPLPPPTDNPQITQIFETQTLPPKPSPVSQPTNTPSGPVTDTPGTGSQPAEVILILAPGPGSRVVSPLRLSGEADPTFEQNLVVTIFFEDGTELTTTPFQIQAETGERGLFEAEIPFTIQGERQALVQVYATSARDGSVTHLSSVWITLASEGEEAIKEVASHPERIHIFSPSQGEAVSGGFAHVEGFALASFEQTLVVEVLDTDGNVIGSQPVTVVSPDLGQPGTFQVDVPFRPAGSGPGRIVVRDESPAFGATVHLSSVEVNLE